MKTALFVNFTDQEFVGYWNGKGRKYPPGASEYMPDYLARHFAKHLVNRELLRTDVSGNLIHKNGDKMTSPKKPDDAPIFMELFNKACIEEGTSDDLGEKGDDLNSLISAANKNREAAAPITDAPPISKPRQPKEQEDPNFKRETAGTSGDPQVIIPPDFDVDDEEGSFKGKPTE